MPPHSSTLAWKIPWTEEPGRLQSMGSLRVGHDWVTSLSLFTFVHWRRNWQPTPVFLPGESQGQGSLVGCHLWGRTESDTTEQLSSSSNILFSIMAVLIYIPTNTHICCLWSFLVTTILIMWGAISLWLWFAFLWWLAMLRIFSTGIATYLANSNKWEIHNYDASQTIPKHKKNEEQIFI